MRTSLITQVSLALVLAACASSPTQPTHIPDGTYITSVTPEEFTSVGISPAIACENAGTFTLTVVGDRWGYVQTATPGCTVENPQLNGSWEITGDEVAFQDDESFGCSTTYRYNWSFDGTELHFTTIDDTCPPRVVYQTAHPWVLQK